MFGTYKKEDVTLLLKDISGAVQPLDTAARERLIQGGAHYSSMLPVEYEPSAQYLELFFASLAENAAKTALSAATAAEKILRQKGKNAVLVSLARAGTPAGILIKRYLREKRGIDAPHYSISIIRGKGIDKNAMNYILARHKPQDLQFVDGWTGKGAIGRELTCAMADFAGVSDSLAVLADPARIAAVFGTREDFLIPSSCLNSTVSGLLSRTFLREDIIGENDFHGAVFYADLREKDLTYRFIDTVAANFPAAPPALADDEPPTGAGLREAEDICRELNAGDINFVKPGIGEATRVLLRRVPRCVLVNSSFGAELRHIYRLAEEKNVPLREYPLKNYKACGIIKKLGDL